MSARSPQKAKRPLRRFWHTVHPASRSGCRDCRDCRSSNDEVEAEQHPRDPTTNPLANQPETSLSTCVGSPSPGSWPLPNSPHALGMPRTKRLAPLSSSPRQMPALRYREDHLIWHVGVGSSALAVPAHGRVPVILLPLQPAPSSLCHSACQVCQSRPPAAWSATSSPSDRHHTRHSLLPFHAPLTSCRSQGWERFFQAPPPDLAHPVQLSNTGSRAFRLLPLATAFPLLSDL